MASVAKVVRPSGGGMGLRNYHEFRYVFGVRDLRVLAHPNGDAGFFELFQESLDRGIAGDAEVEGAEVVLLGLLRIGFVLRRVEHREIEMGVAIFGIDRDGIGEGFLRPFDPALAGRDDADSIIGLCILRVAGESGLELGEGFVKFVLEEEGAAEEVVRQAGI